MQKTHADRHFRFALREGHTITLHIDGTAFFPAMLEAIEQAQGFILLEMYLFASGSVAQRFIGALTRARQRGVRVYLLIDDLGSRELNRADQTQLHKAGVQVARYNRLRLGRAQGNLRRNHRKLLLIDGHTAFVGGAGITDQFDPLACPDQYWHELMAQISGPCVNDWHTLFKETWDHCTHIPLESQPMRQENPRAPGYPARVITGKGLLHREIRRDLLRHINKAQTRAWLATAYFAPTRRLRKALLRAARRGVDVRLLLPGPHSDHPLIGVAGRRFYGRLLRHGVRIYEYQPRFLHAKFFLCDQWSSLGSSNLDHWTQHWNLEANQAIYGEGFARELQALFTQDFALSREVRWQDWSKRGRWQRLQERFWGFVDEWLSRRNYRLAVRTIRKTKAGAEHHDSPP